MLNRYIGDRVFYRRVLAIAIPVLIQSGITNFVSLLDNIMVGQVGTLPMSGVSIANQLLLIFNLSIFGANSGGGIFTAQFHGSGDVQGVRYAHRVKVFTCLALSTLCIVLFICAVDPLVGLYLQGGGDPADAAVILEHSRSYMMIMLVGLIPFALTNAYSGTLRETGQTVVPMVGGISAVLVNLVLNYVLIFGHLGLPAMGVKGAAIATVVSRYVELAIVAGWAHLNPKKNPFIQGLYRSLYVPKKILAGIFRKGMPLLLNEFLWATGLAVINQSYSTCGLEVVPALNISNTIYNLSNIAAVSFGSAVGIIMGQMLGAGRPEKEIRDTNRKLIALTVFCGAIMGVSLLGLSDVFPRLYNTTEAVRELAATAIRITGVMLPVYAFTFATYYTMRSGGQALITFLFDSCFLWCFPVTLSFLLTRFTGLTIVPLYAICQGIDSLRCILGGIMLKKGKWIKNLTL